MMTPTTSQEQQQQQTSTSSSTSTSHSILRILNILQVLLSSIVFLCLMVLIISILTSQKTRKQPYNLYLISLEFVDAIMNAMLVVTIIYYWITLPESFDHNQLINLDPYETSESSIEDDDKTQIQYQHVKLFWIINNSIVIFATTVNMYLSAIVSYHIYRLLQSSFLARQIRPPTTLRIIFESSCVYLFAISIAICYGWSSTFVKLSEEDEYNKFLMGWGIGISLGMVIPFCFIAYITIQIWKRNLLTLSERRTRTITIYFGRIVFVFIVFYIPGTILFALGVSILENSARWTRMAGTILLSLQGGFSCGVALMKPDVQEAVIDFLPRCCCNNFNDFHFSLRRKKKPPFGRQSDIISMDDDDGNSNSNNNNNNNNNNNASTTAAAAAAAAAIAVVEETTTINNISNNNHYLVVGQRNNYTRRESVVQVQQAADK